MLNHTGEYPVWDPAINLALDAVINHIIHRSCGSEYSEFCRVYYARATGWMELLAPAESWETLGEKNESGVERDPDLIELRAKLLTGRVLADDILDLARGIEFGRKRRKFLGNHDPDLQAAPGTRPASELIVKALDETFRQLDGSGIFRNPVEHGFSTPTPADHEWRAGDEKLRSWERTAWQVLTPLLTPDPRSSLVEFDDYRAVLPVLNGSDRRGVLRSLWNPLLPEIDWNLPVRRPSGSVQVYLDVSGSMEAEMQSLVTLLSRLRRWIRMPFWAFSDEVAPATIRNGILRTSTTGGTSMNCVLAHLAETRPTKALVVTDGYIGRCRTELLHEARNTSIYALVSRDGNPAQITRAGIGSTQLSPHPH
jgi:hypothetical protein